MSKSLMKSLGTGLLGAVALGLARLSAPGAEIMVPSGSITTIQDGVDAAAPGDTVLVQPGSYDGVSIIGPGKAGLQLKAVGEPGSVKVVAPGWWAGIYVQADGVTVEGFEVSGSSYGIIVQGPAPGVKIIGNRIGNVTDQYGRGIALLGCADAEVARNSIFGRVYNGIDLGGGSTAVQVHDNTVLNALTTGLNLDSSSTGCELDHNTTSGSGTYGIGVGGSGHHIHHNKVDNNGWSDPYGLGIMAWQAPNNQFDHNEVDNNNNFGIYLASSPNCAAEYNQANDNGSIGILLDGGDSANCTISFNDANGNGYCGIGVGADANYGTTFDHNSAYGNGTWDFAVLWDSHPPFNYTCVDNRGVHAFPTPALWDIQHP